MAGERSAVADDKVPADHDALAAHAVAFAVDEGDVVEMFSQFLLGPRADDVAARLHLSQNEAAHVRRRAAETGSGGLRIGRNIQVFACALAVPWLLISRRHPAFELGRVIRRRLTQAERPDDLVLHKAVIRFSARRLDDLAEQGIAPVGIFDALDALRGLDAPRVPPQTRFIGEGAVQRPESRLVAVARQARRMAQQLPDGHGFHAGFLFQPWQVFRSGIVERQQASFLQKREAGGREHFGLRCHAENMFGRQFFLRLQIGVAPAAVHQQAVLIADGDRQARQARARKPDIYPVLNELRGEIDRAGVGRLLFFRTRVAADCHFRSL